MVDTTGLTSDRIYYPECDGQPIAESNATRDYLLYCVEVLRLYFKSRPAARRRSEELEARLREMGIDPTP